MEIDNLQKRIGIIGGGQLGKMMIQEAKKLGFYVVILDPTPGCPAHSVADEHIVGDFKDADKIQALAARCDVVTYEIEHIATQPLLEIEEAGKEVYPTPKSLLTIQDKYTQKKVLQEHNVPVAPFLQIETEAELARAANTLGYPVILKTRTGGYDGRGNAAIQSKEQLSSAYEALGSGKIPLMVEKMIDFEMETSILVCRGKNADIKVYPVGNNVHKDNILIETIVPADINQTVGDKAMTIAKRVMEIFDGVGMFCIELFVTADERVLVNEIAPRPHNSGHYTIEGCVTSQFEQHIRAITGLPLGDTTLIRPTVMMNLLGEPGHTGVAFYSGLQEALQADGMNLHIYGKQLTSPKRKMGHFTITATDINTARQTAHHVYKTIKVITREEAE